MKDISRRVMNSKQKLGYTLLGAGIMAVGITIGHFAIPSINANSNGVFDTVICNALTVTDKTGNMRIVLDAGDVRDMASIGIMDKNGGIAAGLVGGERGTMLLLNFLSGERGIGLAAIDEVGSHIEVSDQKGNVVWETP